MSSPFVLFQAIQKKIGSSDEEIKTMWAEALAKVVQNKQNEHDTLERQIAHIHGQIEETAKSLKRNVPKTKHLPSSTLQAQLNYAHNILEDFTAHRTKLKQEIELILVKIDQLSHKLELDVAERHKKMPNKVTKDRKDELEDYVRSLEREQTGRTNVRNSLVSAINGLVRELNTNTTVENNETKLDNVNVVLDPKTLSLTIDTFAELNERRFCLEHQLREHRKTEPRIRIEKCRRWYVERKNNSEMITTDEFKQTYKMVTSSAKLQDRNKKKEMDTMKKKCLPSEIIKLMKAWAGHLENWEDTYQESYVYVGEKSMENVATVANTNTDFFRSQFCVLGAKL